MVKLKRHKNYFLLFSICIAMLSCGKDSEIQPDNKPDDETSTTVPFYKLQRVENFHAQVTDESPTTPSPTVFFSLENKKEAPSTYLKTNRWDISFGSLYSSFMAGNNGKDSRNHGFQSTGTGGITVVVKPFAEVVDVPDDNAFKTGRDLIGTDDAGDFGEGTGWYLYDFGGTKVRDNAFDNQHIAHALGEELTLSNGNKVAPRTIIIRTAKGNYAKIKMISVYKDLFQQSQWTRKAAKMFFTFEYVLVPAGSKKFEIK